MGTIPYLTNTPTGLFKYRRRIPKELIGLIDSKEIIRSLGKNHTEAVKKANEINTILDEATELTRLSSIPKSVIEKLLSSKLQTKTPIAQQDKQLISYIVGLYLEQSNVTPMEYSNRLYFFKSLLPSLLKVLVKKEDLDINSLSYDVILKIRKVLVKMPNRNYSQYKTMNLTELVSIVNKGSLKVPTEHLQSPDTINKMLKRIKSLLFFAQDLGLYTESIPKAITIQAETSSRDYKAILEPEELQQVFKGTTNEDVRYINEVLYFTGMRRSELYKCELTEVEGVLCFDLRSPRAKLKTKSSYRLIPVHDKLLYKIDEFIEIMQRVKPDRLTKTFTRVANRVLENTQGKTLYSLRHTFATTLIASSVSPEVASEILGHQHSTMTMNRYVKGFPIKVLKEAIDKL